VSQAQAWEAIAEHWLELVRGSVPDDFHAYNSEAFFELLPPPHGRVLDLGCGEGRLARELRRRGYDVVGIDASPTLVRLAGEADPTGEYRVADAAALPFADGSFDLVIPFMSLQDMDDATGALREAARVLAPGGRLCLAILHPLRTAGIVNEEAGTLVIEGSYYETVSHVRPGIQVPSIHRPLDAYLRPLEEAGLLVEALRELASEHALGGGRIPACLHLRALKP
jgi:SAM-dependent methyltransferase